MTTKDKKLTPPPSPPTEEDLLEVFRRNVSPEYAAAVEADESFALFRGMAATFARSADAGARSIQARYRLPSAYQTHAPAAGGSYAMGYVTLTRNKYLADGVTARPGELRIEGPSGRTYANAETINWYPGDGSERRALFVSEVLGFLGNLDWLADENGELEVAQFSVVNQDLDKAGVNATVTTTTELQTTVVDTGVPAVFSPQDVGLYLLVNASANTESVGELRKIESYSFPAEEDPVGSGLYPSSILLSSTPIQNPSEVFTEDNSAASFTSVWAEATSNDLLTWGFSVTPDTDDAVYFAAETPFAGIRSEIDTAGVGVWTVVLEYWNGSAWTTFADSVDQTAGWTLDPELLDDPTELSISWTIPSDWAASASPLTGDTKYLARARFSSVTSVTQPPLFTRVQVYPDDPLAPEAGTLTWAVLDYESLGVEIAKVETISGGADNDLYILGQERDLYQRAGESDESFRKRLSSLPDVVSPNSVRRVVNRALDPYGVRGEAIDVQKEVRGLFLDVPPGDPFYVSALDMYDTGDAFPEEPWFLLLSADEAYGHGYILVPYLMEGEFGIFLDEGPIYTEDYVSFTGPAAGGWLDGFPITGYAVYSSLYNSVARTVGHSINFTLIRSDDEALTTC